MSRPKAKAMSHRARGGSQKHSGRKQAETWTKLPERAACPTPGKQAFHSRKEAKAALKKLRASGLAERDHYRLQVYHCACLRWHYGGVHPARAQGTWVEPRVRN